MPYIVYQKRKGKKKWVLVALQNDGRWLAVPTRDPNQGSETMSRSQFNKMCPYAELRKDVDKAFAEAKELSVKVDRTSITNAIEAVKKL